MCSKAVEGKNPILVTIKYSARPRAVKLYQLKLAFHRSRRSAIRVEASAKKRLVGCKSGEIIIHKSGRERSKLPSGLKHYRNKKTER